MRRSTLINIIIILLILALVLVVKLKPHNKTSEEIAKCIGERATLYVQLGCHYCEIQEKMFGENVKYLNKIDCFFERDKCAEIKGTPTWKINGEYYLGVQTIEKLRELTGC